MPTVELPRGQKVGTAALPGVRLTAHETPTSEGAGVEEARAQKFGALGYVGKNVSALGQELGVEAADTAAFEKQKADTLVALKTSNDLDTKSNQILNDPQTGALNNKGPATLGATQKALDEFDKHAAEIERTLTNDTQRIAFQKQKQQGRLAIAVTLDKHADAEMQKYRGEELQAFVLNQRNTAVQNANDPRIVGAALHTAEDAISLHAGALGLGPEQEKELVEKTRTSTHAGVITELLAQGQTKQAQIYFDHAKNEITVGDTRAQLERQLEVATTATEGLHASEKIWDTLGPKGDTDPINIDKMEDAARKQFADDPKALDATMKYLRERKAVVDAGRKDREEAQLGGLWSKVAAGAGLTQIQRDPAYLSAPGRVQVQIKDYILGAAERNANRAYAEEGRAYTAAQRLEKDKETKGWSRYWDLSDPKTLDATSEGKLQSLRGELGDDHVNRLLAQKRALNKGEEAVRAATIDDDAFKTKADAAGMHPYAEKQDELSKRELGRLKAAVEREIDQAQRVKGKELTREEKDKITDRLIDEKVMFDYWGTDPTKVAASVTDADDRTKAYVPIADIREKQPKQLSRYLNYARSLGAAQQRMSDDELIRRYGDRFQHAEGLRRLGGTDAEIAAAIRGQ